MVDSMKSDRKLRRYSAQKLRHSHGSRNNIISLSNLKQYLNPLAIPFVTRISDFVSRSLCVLCLFVCKLKIGYWEGELKLRCKQVPSSILVQWPLASPLVGRAVALYFQKASTSFIWF